MAALSMVVTMAASIDPEFRKQPREPSADQQAKRAGKLEGFRKRIAAAGGEDLGLLRLPVCKPSECRPKWHKLTDDFTGLGQCCRDGLPRRSCCAPAKGPAEWKKCADVLPASDCGMRGVLHRSPKNSPRAGFQGVPLFFADEDVKALLQERPPFGYQGSEVKSVRARQRNATVPAVQRFGSCAVVGNSGTLLQRELGAEIDAHDAVIRVNHAPVAHSAAGRRYARWAGTKTTWRVVTSQVWAGLGLARTQTPGPYPLTLTLVHTLTQMLALTHSVTPSSSLHLAPFQPNPTAPAPSSHPRPRPSSPARPATLHRPTPHPCPRHATSGFERRRKTQLPAYSPCATGVSSTPARTYSWATPATSRSV